MNKAQFIETEIQFSAKSTDQNVSIKGNLSSLHDDPKKIHQLMDLLDLPQGAEAKVITTAASVIVR